MKGSPLSISLVALAMWHGNGPVAVWAQVVKGPELVFFETRIRPLLATRCYECHSQQSKVSKSGLSLDTREGVLRGGNRGPAIVPGKSDESLLITVIAYSDTDLKMPGKGDRLTSDQVADFRKWIDMGAPDPRDAAKLSGKPTLASANSHWSFKPVGNPLPPEIKRVDWVVNPVDRFVLAKLESAGIQPNPPADKLTLLRRVTFDLTGLPPSAREAGEFLADESDEAYARVVDRLLASPRYGERWARHWMDIARYADTKGDVRRQVEDPRFPHAWTYRDYLIDAFNTDKPYDRFLREQIAADLLVESQGEDKSSLAALGFLTLGDRFNGQAHDVINDRIDVVTRGLLGLTVACARCHDHKFDPIPTADYYSLHGIFASSVEPSEPPLLVTPPATSGFTNYLSQRAGLTSKLKDWEEELRVFRRDSRARADQAKRQLLIRRGQQLRNQLALLEMNHADSPPRAHALADADRPRDSRVFIRGDAAQRGAIVPRQFLECLTVGQRKRFNQGSGRLELANAIADPANPLTARVFVNRVWQSHFGGGIVATPDDFGNMAATPTHPELLDWLATRFMGSGWSIKALHRSILLSNTYRQSSGNNPQSARIDPLNALLWRANVRRLDFEALRDSLLAMSGTFVEKQGGRPVELSTGPGLQRRTVYGYLDRNRVPEVLYQFDFPNPDSSTGKRFETIVPQQVLFMMNSPMVLNAARAIAKSAEFVCLSEPRDKMGHIYATLFQRSPSDTELRLGLAFVSTNAINASVQAAPLPSSDAPDRVRPFPLENAGIADATRARGPQRRRPDRPGFRQQQPSPLNPWETYIHALLLSNETAFVN